MLGYDLLKICSVFLCFLFTCLFMLGIDDLYSLFVLILASINFFFVSQLHVMIICVSFKHFFEPYASKTFFANLAHNCSLLCFNVGKDNFLRPSF